MPLLIFIYSMMGLLICDYAPFWQEVSVESSLILKWPLRPECLLFVKCVLLQVHDKLTGDLTQKGTMQELYQINIRILAIRTVNNICRYRYFFPGYLGDNICFKLWDRLSPATKYAVNIETNCCCKLYWHGNKE